MFNKKVQFIILLCILYLQGIIALQCFTCQSSDCQNESKLQVTHECKDILDDCVSVFGETKILQRGCYSELPAIYRKRCDEYNTTLCHRCFEDTCNDRAPTLCVQCNTEDNWNCFRSPADLEPSYCPITVQLNTFCYARYNDTGYMERGCISNHNAVQECLRRHNCKTCRPAAGTTCNNEFEAMKNAATSSAKVYGLLIAVVFLIRILFN